MKHEKRITLLLIFLLAVLILTGCASDEVRLVNEAVMASRFSATDDLSRALARATMDLKAEQYTDYKIGGDDVLSVSIFEWMVREEMKTVEVRVSEQGNITLPLLGGMKAKGRTVAEIEEGIVKCLTEDGFILSPRVSVTVKEFLSKSIAVVGAVEKPGQYHLRQNVATLLDALSMAGGMNDRAGYVIYVIRPQEGEAKLLGLPEEGEQGSREEEGAKESKAPTMNERAMLKSLMQDGRNEVIVIDMIELLQEGNLNLNVVLTKGNVVYVPEAPLFYVLGFVRQPGGFPLKRPTTVLEGVALANGLMEAEASPRYCVLKRKLPEGEIVIPLDLVAISQGEEPNLYLAANDIIDVRQTAWKKTMLAMYDFFTRLFTFGYNLADL